MCFDPVDQEANKCEKNKFFNSYYIFMIGWNYFRNYINYSAPKSYVELHFLFT